MSDVAPYSVDFLEKPERSHFNRQKVTKVDRWGDKFETTEAHFVDDQSYSDRYGYCNRDRGSVKIFIGVTLALFSVVIASAFL